MAAPNTTRVRARPGVAVVPREARCRMRQVFFASNSAELDDEARRQLSAYARCLAGAPDDQDVLLTSHTDASGTEDYNQTLSEQRAEAVAAFLQSRGVAEDRIEIRALGDQGVIEGVPGLWPLQRRVTLAPPGTPTGVTSSVPQRVPPGTAVPAAP